MGVLKSINKAFSDKEIRGWDKLYYSIDLHSTVIKPNYEYGNIPTEFYPYAKETLQLLSKLDDISLIMWTCSHPHEIDEYIKLFNNNDIKFDYINENTEVKTMIDGYGCYDKKFYFNVLLDDKASFDADTEWEEIYNYLKDKFNII